MSCNAIVELLVAVGHLRERHQATWRKSATRFNVFDALNIERKELPHSQFLAFLLNPRQRHDQGDRYLRSFLSLLDISVRGGLDRADVTTEHTIAPYGWSGELRRLDILVRIPSVLTLGIENKVDAQDQEYQIRDYLAWLGSQTPRPDIRALVYLTPQARAPQSSLQNVDDQPLKLLSYAQIADWLECECRSVPDRLVTVADMYVQTCRKIGGVTMRSDDDCDIGQLLTTPHQFANALEIARGVAREKPRVIERFWLNVRELLRTSLVRESWTNKWAVEMSPDLDNNG
jgi:hypothetical protein